MRDPLARWVAAWDHFWFEPADSATLGLLRWFSGGMLLYTHLVWGLALQPFFGPDGWQDQLLVQHSLRDTLAPSFWWSVPPSLLGVTHVACLLILLLYWVGLFHRVTPWLAFAITVSYINRVPLANFGLDQINSLLVAYVAVGYLGLPTPDARLTTDRAWFRWRQQPPQQVVSPSLSPQPRVSVRLAL
ncbi:MAG: thiol-disulfide oxidoreductase, partial [Planctomycetaceae bacterium]